MPRILIDEYYARHLSLRTIWLHYRYVYAVLPIDQQWPVHDLYQPSKTLSLSEFAEHLEQLKQQRPSLPNAASKARLRLYRIFQQADLESAGDDQRFQAIIRQHPPKPRYRRKALKGLYLAPVVHHEPNLKLLSCALMELHEQLGNEQSTVLPKPKSPRTMVSTMQGLSDEERKQVLSEVLLDELKAIRELVQDVPIIKHDFEQLKADVGELKNDMKVVKAAVTDQSRQLANHEARLTHLENAA